MTTTSIPQDRFLRKTTGEVAKCSTCPVGLATHHRRTRRFDIYLCDACVEAYEIARRKRYLLEQDEDAGYCEYVEWDDRSDAVRENDSLLASCPRDPDEEEDQAKWDAWCDYHSRESYVQWREEHV